MGELKSWIVSICTAVFFITAIEMLLPDNNMKKYAKFVMGLILITVLINPLVMLLNNGITMNTFLGKSIGLIDEPDTSVNSKQDYKKTNIDATLKVFQQNLEEVCKKKLKEKFVKGEYEVKAEVLYNEKKAEYEIKSLEVEVANGKVEKIQKIEVKPSSNFNDRTRVQSEMSGEIKEFLSNELKVSADMISVYKSRT
jgi:stage III sporulation protein AF